MEDLAAAVQHNCDVADARHAADLTLCTYLLQMRELYRWEARLPLGTTLPREAVGAWLDRREERWDGLAESDYLPLPGGAGAEDLYDTTALNASLVPQGLVYGAGRLAGGRPLFVLAELLRTEVHDGLQVLVAGRELARGLMAPPAASRGATVLLRRDALLRWLWTQHEAAQLRPEGGGAFAAALAATGGDDVAAALERMADDQLQTLLLHEIGEHRAGALLGPRWDSLRQVAGGDRRLEPRLRALRDHFADCLVTLPALLDRGAAAAIHFWFAGLDGVRLEMFPRAAAAYLAWRGGDGGRALRAAADAGRAHWARLAAEAVEVQRVHGEESPEPLRQLLAAPSNRC